MKVNAKVAITRYYTFETEVPDDATNAEIRYAVKEQIVANPDSLCDTGLAIEEEDINDIYGIEEE